MKALALTLLFLLGIGSLAEARIQDPVVKLRVWTERRSRIRRPFSPADEEELRALLGDLRLLAKDFPERRRDVDLALVDLATVDWVAPNLRAQRPGDPGGPGVTGGTGPISTIALQELEWRFRRDKAGLAAWMSRDLLASEDSDDRERRLVAADSLEGRYYPVSLPLLLRAARSEDEELRLTAEKALIGWPEARVHLHFLDALARGSSRTDAVAAHLTRARDSLGPQALDRLRSEVGALYFSEDWRDASRADELVGILDTPRAVPILIETLSLWLRRQEDGTGSRRIANEVLGELRRISGRSLGLNPLRWNQWWTAVREGRVELPEDAVDGGDSYSSAAFFGLRPVTDKVVFVVDRSGSMDASFGTGGRTRYQEAVEQLLAFLEAAGPETQFRVVLFSDDAQTWRSKMTMAEPRNLKAARRWLLNKNPKGGTQLLAGIQEATAVDRRGRLELEELEADTVVVLCDGATAEGEAWVRPWLRQHNEKAQLVFHCVQLGNGGDGTLRALAVGTDGEFLRISG